MDKHLIADLDYDAIVVGARVAGSTLAALLGDAGYRVLLVDRATFPSPTLSTHYFRGGRAVSVLKRLGVLDEVLDLGCPPLTAEYRFRDGATEPVVGPAQQPGDVAFCLSVRRAPLDHILVRRATRSASVHVLQTTALKEVFVGWSSCCRSAPDHAGWRDSRAESLCHRRRRPAVTCRQASASPDPGE